MAEYIDRNTAIAKVTALEVIEPLSTMVDVKRLLADIPAADVAPVRNGRWEIVVGSNGKEYMVCTCCRVSQDLTGVFTYCPNCGCRMGGDDDESDMVDKCPTINAVPIEELEHLRNELYERDLITMEGLKRLNTLIGKYTTTHNGEADNG